MKRLLFFAVHGGDAAGMALLCHGAGIGLDLGGVGNEVVFTNTSVGERIDFRRLGVESPSDDEIRDNVGRGVYSAVGVCIPPQVDDVRENLLPLAGSPLPVVVHHTANYFDDFRELGIRNFFSPSQRALDLLPECHTYLHRKLLDIDNFPPSVDVTQRTGFASFIHEYEEYWPHAYAKFRQLNRLLNAPRIREYGIGSRDGLVDDDIDAMRHSRATVQIKDAGICCYAVLRSMCVGTPVIMDQETYELGFYDKLEGPKVFDTIDEVRVELERLQSDDAYWNQQSEEVLSAARRQFTYDDQLGQQFREFIRSAVPDSDVAPDTSSKSSSVSLAGLHESCMQGLFSIHSWAGEQRRRLAVKTAARETVSIGGSLVELESGEGIEWVAHWETETIGCIREEVENADRPLFIDVGCSIGHISCTALFANPNSEVIAIDSDLASLVETEKNCQFARHANKRLTRVHGLVGETADWPQDYQQAAVATTAALPFADLEGGPLYRNRGAPAHILDDIPRHSLDSLFLHRIESSRPLLVKIDVEGGEYHVLEGGRFLLTSLKPLLLLSVHPTMLPPLGQSVESVERLLQELGYSFEKIAVDHEEHWRCVYNAANAEL